MRFGSVVVPVDERSGGRDLPLLSVSQYWGVRPREEVTEDLSRAEDLTNYKAVRAGELVINRMSAYQGALGLSPCDGVTSPDYMVLRLRPDQEGRYWAYLMKSAVFVNEMAARVRGIGTLDSKNVRTPRISFGELKLIDVPDLTSDEQRAIADFLDRETAKIDALIAKQKKLVTLLEERRMSLVDSALHKFPRQPLRRWWTVIDCKHVTAEFVSEGGYPLVSIGQVQGWEVDLSSAKRTTREWFDVLREPPRVPQTGDLVMSRNASVGKVATVTDDTPPFALGQDVVLLKPRLGAVSEFLRYALESSEAVRAIGMASIGSTFKRINVAEIKAMTVPFPPAQIQRVVADKLKGNMAEIDKTAIKAEEFIALARERRAALITAAVTGQVDVLERVS